MVIVTPFQAKKKQRYLILILVVSLLGIGFVVWYKFLPQQPKTSHTLPQKPPEIDINFDVLKNPFLSKLSPFEGIPYFNPADAGRSNPLQPY